MALKLGNYSRILGELTLEKCQEKISTGIKIKFFPGFLEKAYLSNEWKNGDKKTLYYNSWNNGKDILSVTFKITKSRGISGSYMASFILDEVDIVSKGN